MKHRFPIYSMAFLCPTFLFVSSLGQSQSQVITTSSHREDLLRKFLQDYERESYLYNSEAVELRYFAAFYDLNGDDADEAVVYLVGQCGTGGCPLMVFAPEGDSYKVITDSPITRPPIRVLDRSFHGWHSLTFRVAGGGVPDPYDAELRFDGERYPWNANEAPAVKRNEPGVILIPEFTSEAPASSIFGTHPEDRDRQGKPLFLRVEQPICPPMPPEKALQRALEIYLMRVHFRAEKSLTNIGYYDAFTDLDGDGRLDAIIYLTGPDWWRSILVLAPVGNCYQVIGHLRGLELPVRVLQTSSRGWRHLAGKLQRAGAADSFDVEYEFNGRSYVRSEAKLSDSSPRTPQAGDIVLRSGVAAPKPLFGTHN